MMREMDYRSSNKTVSSTQYHLVWCPKDRRRVLGGVAGNPLKRIIARVVTEVEVRRSRTR
ncbi:MAG: transposase [Acidimicrobiia bacterium]|nr:transposase [Acidimicrobiia bacterium]